ncbi:hypothetical protein OSCI_4070016 [Kamptonema sp. PCC 6506]|nr:hypothetical protein OSCI_4070016 [Kamptonema sp. PCC 6506]
MISIPGGSFVMGSPDTEAGRPNTEGPQHNVTATFRRCGWDFFISCESWEPICFWIELMGF